MNPEPVTRLNFIQGMVEAGLSYDAATRAYNSFLSTFADGIVNGRKIYLGQIGVLNPSVLPPRRVKMNFEKSGDGTVRPRQREFFLDSRIKYSFRLFTKFARTHELKWAA